MELTHLIDTVHFTDSHHSRMLQLADLYVWLLQLCTNPDPEAHPQKIVVCYVREKTDILSPNKYKVWPTNQSWYHVQNGYRDRDALHKAPLPHHAAYGSVLRDSADQAESDPGKHKSK